MNTDLASEITETNEPIKQEEQPSSPNKKTVKLSFTVPTERLSFVRQQEIARAYVTAYERHNKPVAPGEVAPYIGIASTTLIMANAFFVENGILIRENGKYAPCQELCHVEKAAQFGSDKAWFKLSPVIEKSWFGSHLIAKVKMRPISEPDAIHELAMLANAEKEHEPQLKVILEYLLLTGTLRKESGSFRLGEGYLHRDDETPSKAPLLPGKEKQSIDEPDLEEHSLTLDAGKKRKITIRGPAQISERELKRIQDWLAVQFEVTPTNL